MGGDAGPLHPWGPSAWTRTTVPAELVRQQHLAGVVLGEGAHHAKGGSRVRGTNQPALLGDEEDSGVGRVRDDLHGVVKSANQRVAAAV